MQNILCNHKAVHFMPGKNLLKAHSSLPLLKQNQIHEQPAGAGSSFKSMELPCTLLASDLNSISSNLR